MAISTSNINWENITKKTQLNFFIVGLAILASFTVHAKNIQIFTDVSKLVGINFTHQNGMNGNLYFPEVVSGGGALIDYDKDGDLDVYLVQGGVLVNVEMTSKNQKLGGRLYRNEGVDPKTLLPKFIDVTEESHIQSFEYGMGVAVGDVNNDGWPDLYLTNFGHNQLWLNQKGTFIDYTETAGVDDVRWSVSASFGDVDNDGDLDLYVGNYVDYKVSAHKNCKRSGGKLDYCSPKSYKPVSDRLFLNNGKGVFEDISLKSGISKHYGGALGVIMADFDGDHQLDIYVANDGVPNQLWMNKGEGIFENEALLAGAAVNSQGMSEASMGVTAEDYDDDGDIDLFMTHMENESNTLYVNDGSGWFDDKTTEAKLAQSSLPYTSFGVAWIDYDLDMDLDLFIANGAVILDSVQEKQGIQFPLNQMNQLLENEGNGQYKDISVGQDFISISQKVSRGLLVGDIDNDGDTDLIVTNDNAQPQVLLNNKISKNHWIGFNVTGDLAEVAAIGTTITLKIADKKSIVRRSHRDGSYASSNDPRILFGLNKNVNAQSIDVEWMDGSHERWDALVVDKYHLIKKGTGTKIK